MSTVLTACGGVKASSEAAEKHERQVFAMDTIMMLTAYGENGEAALVDAESVIYGLEEDLDPENPWGSVYNMNLRAGEYVSVSDDCINIMSTTLEHWKASGGALDPALHPIILAWGFTTGEHRVPPQTEINGLLADKNTEGILVDEEGEKIYIPAGTKVSLGAVGKGYTAQKALEVMEEAGVESAIVSLGGNVQTLGDTKPNGEKWQVAVTDPHDTGSYVGILSIGEAAVVTSGGYQRYFEQDGKTYIHIIDPATGYPVENDLLSVTVVTEDGADADALSTTLFVMGAEGALDYYRSHEGFELVLITTDNEVMVTAGLADCFTERGSGYTYEYIAG